MASFLSVAAASTAALASVLVTEVGSLRQWLREAVAFGVGHISIIACSIDGILSGLGCVIHLLDGRILLFTSQIRTVFNGLFLASAA